MPNATVYKFKAKLWLYPGMAGWTFLTLPVKMATEINKRHGFMARGWGSLPVLIRIGKTEWKTSIFPDKKKKSYLLPVKADVRRKEALRTGATVQATFKIRLSEIKER